MRSFWLALILAALASAQYPVPTQGGGGVGPPATPAFVGVQNSGTDVVCALHADVITGLTCNNQVTDATTETAFASSVTIPAGTLSNNKTAVNFNFGYIATATIPTVTFRVKLNGTTIYTSNAAAAGTGSSGFALNCNLVAAAAASAATPVIFACAMPGPNNSQIRNTLITNSNLSVAVNTAVATTLTVTAQFGAATTQNALWLYSISPDSGGPAGPAGQQLPSANSPAMPNLRAVRVFGSQLAAGTADLYTVPAGRRLYVTTMTPFQTAGASGTFIPEIKLAGVYYPISTSTASTLLTNSTAASLGIILEAGETLAALTTGTTLNVFTICLEFDAAGSPWRSVKLAGTAAGANLVYTVPAGKTAIPFNLIALSPGTPQLGIQNDAGGTHTFNIFQVPNGGAPDITNQTAVQSVVASGRGNAPFIGPMAAGDAIWVTPSTNAASQIIWVNVYEL